MRIRQFSFCRIESRVKGGSWWESVTDTCLPSTCSFFIHAPRWRAGKERKKTKGGRIQTLNTEGQLRLAFLLQCGARTRDPVHG